MGSKSTDQTQRRKLRIKLERQGVPADEVARRVAVLRNRQAERNREEAKLAPVPVGCTPRSVVERVVTSASSEVVDLVMTGRALRRDETEGNWERFGWALDAFDGVL